MGASKKMYVTMLQEHYHEIPTELKLQFFKAEVIYDNDYELYKDDPMFKQLRKAKKKADKELKDWKFKQRHL
jgi:hypothetical protein